MVSPWDRVLFAVIFFVAFQHLAFFVLETFLWQKPLGLKVFRQSPEKAAITAPLAKNQGVYNAFLAAGLFWGVITITSGGLGYVELGRAIFIFFLSCVSVAGITGALTVNRRIFWIQAVPAIVGLGLVFLR